MRELLRRLDVDTLGRRRCARDVVDETSQHRKKMLLKRLKIVDAFRNSGDSGDARNKPEWMILDVIPVIPPDLRPLVPLDGGRFATSDLNDLYRRVINRNNRLQKLIMHRAPEVILRNEKRMLQEAVDALFDNGRRSKAIRGRGKRPLKSLSDMLKGKQGRFRQNLLGKRVDYSGRSVIVVGPELQLHQCGLPKLMALELFKPFIIHKLVEKGIAETVKRAKKIVERESPEVYEILEEIIRDHPVLLNRAPTLHRLGIQAFEPVLVEGKAIRIHPLVCAAFNADFDGDQMAVHVPLSFEAQLEARLLMLSSNNILKPSDGRPVAEPQPGHRARLLLRDQGAGRLQHGRPQDARAASRDVAEIEMELALEPRDAAARALLLLRATTTDGRALGEDDGRPRAVQRDRAEGARLQEPRHEEEGAVGARVRVLPQGGPRGDGAVPRSPEGVRLRQRHARRRLDRHRRSRNPDGEGRRCSRKPTERVERFQRAYQTGNITNGERYNKVIDTWTHANSDIADEMVKAMRESKQGFNPVFMMFDSGSRGSRDQIRQLAGMRGLMAKPQKKLTGGIGEIIESPIKSNFREGLSPLEYFTSTHGARKGLADTALKTADAGYLTRRLVDVAQDVTITEEDCGTIQGLEVAALKEGEDVIEPLAERIVGNVAAEDVEDPHELDESGRRTLLVEAGQLIDEETAHADRGVGHRDGEDPLRAHLRGEARSLPHVLRPQPGDDGHGRPRRGGRHHRRAVDRRAGHAAHAAHVPHRWNGGSYRRADGAQVEGRGRRSSTAIASSSSPTPRDSSIVTSYEGEILIKSSSDKNAAVARASPGAARRDPDGRRMATT